MKLGLDKYKVLQLKGVSGEKLNLTREATDLPILKKQIIKDEYKNQDTNIDLNETKATEDYNPYNEEKIHKIKKFVDTGINSFRDWASILNDLEVHNAAREQ